MFNKKTLVVCGILFLSLFSFGCNVSSFFKDDANTVTKVGILKEKVADVSSVGISMFSLVDDKGGETRVRSLVLNLGSNEYLDNKVQIMGVMNTKENVFEVSGVSVLEVLSKNKDDKNLVSYKNTDIGFELNYPNDWTLEDNGNSLVLSAPTLKAENAGKADSISILQTPFTFDPVAPNKDGVRDALAAYSEKNFPGGTKEILGSFNKIGVDALDALKVTRDSNEDIYLYRNGLIYQISFVSGSPMVAENKKTYHDLLSSFKFTGFTASIPDSGGNTSADASVSDSQLPTVDMKFSTFESVPFHFKGEYPAKWYYSGGASANSSYHYTFSETADGDELIGLDVSSGDFPEGKKLKFGTFECVEVDAGDKISIYVKTDKRMFVLSGDKQYRDIILLMSSKISGTGG